MVAVSSRVVLLLAVLGITIAIFFVYKYDMTARTMLESGSPSDLDAKPSKLIYRGGEFNRSMTANRPMSLEVADETFINTRKDITETNLNAKPSKLIYQGEFNRSMTRQLTPEVADEIFYNFVVHRHYICEDTVRLGSVKDGGWDACLAGTYQLKKPCLVYSFGISYDFTFDDAVSNFYGCKVRSFDPSMDVEDHKRNDNIYFYRTGLGKANQNRPDNKNGWRIRNFVTLLEELGDKNKTIDYFKMDIEWSEWESMESMFETNILQSNVKQFALETHMTANTDPGELYGRWKILKQLEDIGFKRWYWHMNPACGYSFGGHKRSQCYEMVYINTAFLNRPPASSAVTQKTSS